jgi:hypothetical protein
MVEELTAQGGTNRLELQNQPKTINKDMKLTLYQVNIFPNSFYYLQFGISSGCSRVEFQVDVVEWLAALNVKNSATVLGSIPASFTTVEP